MSTIGRALCRRLLTGLLGLLGLAGMASAETARVATESELQALFLLNFARLTEWPAARFEEAAAPLVLCVDPRREALLAALRRSGVDTVHGRPLALRELPRGDTALRDCHLLFIDAAELRRTGPGQLSVGDGPGFTTAGGIIGLVRSGLRLRFEVNREAAQRAQLRLSSELLKLALAPGEGARP